jgi:MFS transporter, DHA2 family, methylenomycin A resistance protein
LRFARDSRPPISDPHLTLATVCLGYFVASWAMGPVASILPTLTRELETSVTAAGWIMSAYFVMLVGTVLVMGRLGDLVGQGRVFGLGAALFTAAGLLCGLSNSFGLLLVARGIQGVGSAMIFGTSLAIIASAIPGRSRGIAIGCLTVASGASSLFGVWLATWSVQHLSWQWAFLAPTPIGALAAVMGLRLRLPSAQVASRRMDWAGAALLFATLVAGVLALNHLHEGDETFEAGAPYHVGMHVLTLALLVAFLKVEQRSESPLLGFRLLGNSAFSSGIAGNGIAHMSMLATSFLLPFLLERGRGLTPTHTGQLMITQQAAMVVCSLALGYLYDRFRSAWFGAVMMGSIAGGLVALGLFGGGLPFAALLGIVIMLGGGLGGFTTVNNTAVMSMAPDDQHGFASGLVETTRQLGHAVGVSLSSSFMGSALAQVAEPGPGHYVDGFQQAALAMGLVAALGVAVLLWPRLRGTIPSPSSGVARRASRVSGL